MDLLSNVLLQNMHSFDLLIKTRLEFFSEIFFTPINDSLELIFIKEKLI